MKTDYDVIVIGAGSAGLTVAAAAAQIGARVMLVERSRMGGDCLNTGCVPSKALIHIARQFDHARRLGSFGFKLDGQLELTRVRDYVRGRIATIEPNDSVERFTGLGVDVRLGEDACFLNPRQIEISGRKVSARRFVIATGASPALPNLPGLTPSNCVTNETIFELDTLPRRMAVIGGGAIGLEMAQAFSFLGSSVEIIEAYERLLPREETFVGEQLGAQLGRDGVGIHLGTRLTRVEDTDQQTVLHWDGGSLSADLLLVAVGRRPRLEGLGLDAAGVSHSARGIEVDPTMRTSQGHIFACGDVTGGPQFTHWASYQAGIVVRNALFGLRFKVHDVVPSVIFTSPEFARVGLTLAQARDQFGDKTQAYDQSLEHNDRSIVESESGHIRVVVSKRGRVLGAHILAQQAGEMLPICIQMVKRAEPLSRLLDLVVPYPTRSEALKAVALQRLQASFTQTKRRWIKRLLRLRG